nr:LD-carboxypeptidase [Glycomyces amatae]
MRRPRRLAPGDRVAVVSPSSPSPPEGVDTALEVLRRWGLEPVEMPHARDLHPWFTALAGTDEDRAADFQAAWEDPSIAAVVCARGGYGANRMVDLVDWEALRGREPKALIGFSDITTLHEAVALRLGVASVHGPMPTWSVFLADEGTREHLRRTLFEPEGARRVESVAGRPLTGGTAAGVTVGGCLSMLAAGVGTAEHRDDLGGAILLIEETDERPYRIDRMLTQLRRAGWFDGIAGVALGSFTDCGPYEEVRPVLLDQLGGLGVPVAEEFGFGHCAPALTMMLGVEAVLDADAGTLEYREEPLR